MGWFEVLAWIMLGWAVGSAAFLSIKGLIWFLQQRDWIGALLISIGLALCLFGFFGALSLSVGW